MYQLFIIDSNMRDSVKLMNKICDKYENVRVKEIISTKEEAIDLLNKHYQIDVVLINERFKEGGTYLDVLNQIVDKTRYRRAFVVMCDGKARIPANSCVYSVVSKARGIDGIMCEVARIMDYVVTNKRVIKNVNEKITKEMKYLGFDASYKGTVYIEKAVEYMVANPHKNIDKLEKSIYPMISECYNNKVHNIKCDVIRAVAMMYYNCEIEKLKEYFGIGEDKKPNVKTVINTIANKVARG